MSPRLLPVDSAIHASALPSTAVAVPARPGLSPSGGSPTDSTVGVDAGILGKNAEQDNDVDEDGDDEEDDDNASERSGVTATPSEATSAGPTSEARAAAAAELMGRAKATARQLALVDAVSAVLYPQLSAQAGYSVHTASIANAIRAFLLSELGSIATQDWAVAEYSMGGGAADEGAAAGWGEASGGAASDEELDAGTEHDDAAGPSDAASTTNADADSSPAPEEQTDSPAPAGSPLSCDIVVEGNADEADGAAACLTTQAMAVASPVRSCRTQGTAFESPAPRDGTRDSTDASPLSTSATPGSAVHAESSPAGASASPASADASPAFGLGAGATQPQATSAPHLRKSIAAAALASADSPAQAVLSPFPGAAGSDNSASPFSDPSGVVAPVPARPRRPRASHASLPVGLGNDSESEGSSGVSDAEDVRIIRSRRRRNRGGSFHSRGSAAEDVTMASLEASMQQDDPFADPLAAGDMPILPGTTVPLGPGPLAAGLLAACGGVGIGCGDEGSEPAEGLGRARAESVISEVGSVHSSVAPPVPSADAVLAQTSTSAGRALAAGLGRSLGFAPDSLDSLPDSAFGSPPVAPFGGGPSTSTFDPPVGVPAQPVLGAHEPGRQAMNTPGMDLALDLPSLLASPALSAGATPMLPFAPPVAALASSKRDTWGSGAAGAFGALPSGASDDEDDFDDARSDASSLMGHTGASVAAFGFGGAGDDDDDDDDDDETEIPGSRAAARRRRNSMRRDRRAAGAAASHAAHAEHSGLVVPSAAVAEHARGADATIATAASSSDAPEGSDATSVNDLVEGTVAGPEADAPPAQTSFLAPTSRFWEYFCGTTLPKWTWALLEDEPGVAALRRGALEGAIRNLRMSRWWVSRAVAETAYDHLDAFLRHYHSVRRDQQSASAMSSDRVRMAGGRVLVGDRFTEDASCLVELMAAHIEVVAHEHSVMTGDVPPGHSEWVAGQAEMLTRTAISLARTRPILDAHFGTLATAMARLISCRPATGVTVLRRLLASWPRRDCSREVPWLRLTQTTLMATPPPMVKGSSVWTPLFNQLLRCMGSDHQEVACSAIDILSGSMSALLGIIGDRKMRETAKKTLVANECHWSDNVRDKSADLFDAMLDLE